MFPGEYRLRKDTDVDRVLKGKRGVFDPVCGVKYFPNGLSNSRFAVVVSSKVHKSAVHRNHVRRQYREIVRSHLGEIATGFDVVLIASKPALELDYAEKEARLLKVLGKARLYGGGSSQSKGSSGANTAVSGDAVV